MSEEPDVKPMMSPKRDLKQMGKNSQAVVGELREFLANLKGKSPKEMMGSVAESNLLRSIIQSTLVVVFLLAYVNIVAFAMKDVEAMEEIKNSKTEAAMPVQEPKDNQPAATPSDKESSPEKSTADKLGIGEEKATDPATNPLDDKSDDLLDGLDDL